MAPGEAILVKRPRRRPLFFAGWALVVASVLLALFVHRGYLGIAGLVGAVVVARYTLRWTREVTADSAD